MKYLVGVYLSRDQVTFSNSDFTYFRVRDFEYTTECIIFDLLHISLYHDKLVAPQNPDEVCGGVYLSRGQGTFSNPDCTYFRVRDFEYTTECIIFDLLHISLYHGWLVDPQNPDEVFGGGISQPGSGHIF